MARVQAPRQTGIRPDKITARDWLHGMADPNAHQPGQHDKHPTGESSSDRALAVEVLPPTEAVAPVKRWRSANGNGAAAHRYRRAAVLVLGITISLVLALVTHNMMQR